VFSAGGNLRFGVVCLERVTVRVHDGGDKLAGRGLRKLILHARGDFNRGVLLRDLRRGDAGSPLVDVDRAGVDEPGMAVNAGSRVPAQVGLVRVIHAHSHNVLLLAGV
jgi:hypothetical protein